MSATFGVEEEFVLLDAVTLRPVDVGLRAVQELQDACAGAVVREFMPSQIEFATPICLSAGEATTAITAFRQQLEKWAEAHHVVAAATGTPMHASQPSEEWSGRYREIGDAVGTLAIDHQINGQHVHVGIPDEEAGIRAMNTLRPWLPVVLAMSANSPFWQGEDTGFASWRAMHSRRWTTYGIPPWFDDAAEYHRAVEANLGIGATLDAACINWSARLSSTHPTLEVRVCDVQLDPTSSVALALIIRALVVAGSAASTPRPTAPDVGDAALWQAARDGLAGTLVDPVLGTLVPASDVVARLRAHLDLPEDDVPIVDAFFESVLRDGTGAQRQRTARLGGNTELAALYCDSISRMSAAPVLTVARR